MLKKGFFSFLLLCLSALLSLKLQAEDVNALFLSAAFPDGVPASQILWIDAPLAEDMATILGHPFQGMRIRYWRSGERTAWIISEIGKLEPITMGLVVENRRIAQVEILVYRESRGHEVGRETFRAQFHGATLTDSLSLDRQIDGITGATLSVHSVTRVARLVLYLDALVTSPASPLQ